MGRVFWGGGIIYRVCYFFFFVFGGGKALPAFSDVTQHLLAPIVSAATGSLVSLTSLCVALFLWRLRGFPNLLQIEHEPSSCLVGGEPIGSCGIC